MKSFIGQDIIITEVSITIKGTADNEPFDYTEIHTENIPAKADQDTILNALKWYMVSIHAWLLRLGKVYE